jgi:hypothetical protein
MLHASNAARGCGPKLAGLRVELRQYMVDQGRTINAVPTSMPSVN